MPRLVDPQSSNDTDFENQLVNIENTNMRTAMDTKMETNSDSDVEIVLTPKSPQYCVGVITIHSDQEEPENDEGWINQVLISPPPKSPTYTGINEAEEVSSGGDNQDCDADKITSDEENEYSETAEINWSGAINVSYLNPIKTFSAESFEPVLLKSLNCSVKTTTMIGSVRVHEIRPKQNIWFKSAFRKVRFISAPTGIVLTATVTMVTNTKSGRRTIQKPILHLQNISNAELETGEDVTALSKYNLRMLAQTSTPAQQLQNIEGRRAVVYLKPEAMSASAMTRYNQTTNFAEAINRFWPTTQHPELPLLNAKVLKVLHSRHERTTNKTTTSTTNPVNRFNKGRRTYQL